VTAPKFQRLNHLNGTIARSPLPAMLSVADEIAAQAVELVRLRRDNRLLREQAQGLAEAYERLVEDNTGLQMRIQELEAERDAAVTEREHFRAMAHQWMAQRSSGTAL
jgi:acyl-[acyl carrier protein]--UDP-N-acetylglucosamine O-acyltransferase